MKIRIRKYNEKTDTHLVEYKSDCSIVHTDGGEILIPFDQSEFLDKFTPDGIWVALDGAKIIGTVLFGKYEKENPLLATIYGIRVDKPYRRRGIGGILLQKADMYARTNRMNKIILHTTSDNIAPITLFRKAGYILTENSGEKLIFVKKMRIR